jgi:vacuolar-type H+-ATPase catalytic subunit A/Vma1
LKAVREKKQIIHKGKSVKITADFSTETLKARRGWGEIFWALNENNFNPHILYLPKLSFKIDLAIKVFHDKQKLKQYVTRPQLQKILQGILLTESEIQHNNESAGSTKLQEKKKQESRE